MVTGNIGVDESAARMLAQHGMKFIWDTHVAAVTAHGLGNNSLAEDLIEIAEGAEEVWLQPSLRR